MEYEIINTGSDGNAVVVNRMIFIDCGVSFKRLQPFIKKIRIIFISHIHSL